ncbi:MAG: type II toxin-antitoxin system VapC family toxin [Burkholderiaceae bacterium]
MILIDSSVLIDITESQTQWAHWSEQQVLLAKSKGDVAINLMVYAEISRDFVDKAQLDLFLNEVGVKVEPLDGRMAYAAARAHEDYRAAGGQRIATLPDFFIGAHANAMRWPLLTRDPNRIRTYFPEVTLICPE